MAEPLRGFFTKSGKIEFFAKSLADKKDTGRPVAALPRVRSRDWMPSAEYPFTSSTGRKRVTHSRTQNNPWLLELKPDNPLIMHPEAASRLMVSTGDAVWVESPHGKIKGQGESL